MGRGMDPRGAVCALVVWANANGCVEREYFPDMAPDSMAGADLSNALSEPPCIEEAEGSTGIFVGSIGTDDPSCGTEVAPCASLQKGIARAVESGLPFVFPMPGSYPESVTLAKDVAIIGGFSNVAGSWRRICPGDPGLVKVVGGDIAMTATDLEGSARIESVTIKNGSTSSTPGRSTYGLFAVGASTDLFLRNVVIESSDATPGSNGSPPLAAGPPKSAGSCEDTVTPAETAGGPGADGMGSDTGSFDQAGYHPGHGADGEAGMLGGIGRVNPDYATSSTCSDCFASGSGASLQCILSPPGYATGYPGHPGCGGQGGPGGGGGQGGGSSFALFVFGAHVAIVDSQLVAGDGGKGGEGTSGAPGGMPSSGTKGGDRNCFANCQFTACLPPCTVPPPPCFGTVAFSLSGGTATFGGNGGAGGQGGGGAGGWSVALVALGMADVKLDGTVLRHGIAGMGGVASLSGQPGMALDAYP
jgi:hypothetical protein